MCVLACVRVTLGVHCASPIDVCTLERVPNSMCVHDARPHRVERSLSDMTGTKAGARALSRARARAQLHADFAWGFETRACVFWLNIVPRPGAFRVAQAETHRRVRVRVRRSRSRIRLLSND